MFLIRKIVKADYDCYLNAFKSSHFRLYGEIKQTSIKDYIKSLILVEYENVYRFILQKDEEPLGFFHIYIQNNFAEVSTGLFKKFNTIYGVYLNALATKVAFDLDKNIEKAIAKIHKENIKNQKIMSSFGGKNIGLSESRVVFELKKVDFPNDFIKKIFRKINQEGLMYEK